MQVFNLDSMTKGWFVGDFSPCVSKSKDFEVAVKYYKKGECESRHYHKIATEITCIAQGRVKMNGVEFSSGAIAALEPKESADFIALEDTITAVVKIPSAKNDKFLGEFVETNTHKDCHFEQSEKSHKKPRKTQEIFRLVQSLNMTIFKNSQRTQNVKYRNPNGRAWLTLRTSWIYHAKAIYQSRQCTNADD